MSFAASVATIAPLATSLKGRRASASSRRPLRVSAASNSPGFSQKGCNALTGVLSVPKELEKEVDAMWKHHEQFMNDTHIIGDAAAEDDVGHPRMLEFYLSKGYEMKEPMNPGEYKHTSPKKKYLNLFFFFPGKGEQKKCEKVSPSEKKKKSEHKGTM